MHSVPPPSARLGWLSDTSCVGSVSGSAAASSQAREKQPLLSTETSRKRCELPPAAGAARGKVLGQLPASVALAAGAGPVCALPYPRGGGAGCQGRAESYRSVQKTFALRKACRAKLCWAAWLFEAGQQTRVLKAVLWKDLATRFGLPETCCCANTPQVGGSGGNQAAVTWVPVSLVCGLVCQFAPWYLSCSSLLRTTRRHTPVVVLKMWVHLPGVQYANIHTERRYFIAYLRKYWCLSQDGTHRSQIDSHLYTSYYHIHLPNTDALLFC